ncbi:MAG: hypothetical protein M0R33_13985 [Methylomonas sp.]|jgi:hypothetical protein|uniref:hypothetical protein n=1 Tax=Methylomonas sp. TaxID=418 RepID=UPI0025CE1933|nr:hypothetical protein [Methylomonas sp.]MCK9607546.1 hypothetical protein [Methylomonas sp.]
MAKSEDNSAMSVAELQLFRGSVLASDYAVLEQLFATIINASEESIPCKFKIILTMRAVSREWRDAIDTFLCAQSSIIFDCLEMVYNKFRVFPIMLAEGSLATRVLKGDFSLARAKIEKIVRKNGTHCFLPLRVTLTRGMFAAGIPAITILFILDSLFGEDACICSMLNEILKMCSIKDDASVIYSAICIAYTCRTISIMHITWDDFIPQLISASRYCFELMDAGRYNINFDIRLVVIDLIGKSLLSHPAHVIADICEGKVERLTAMWHMSEKIMNKHYDFHQVKQIMTAFADATA